MEWLEKQIKIDPPKRTRKITGTRFAAIMGLNAWNTPFKTFCEITKTYEEPFEDTIYTIAGKTIEPKQAEFMKKSYFMTNIVSPTDMYGENYFQKTFGDFFKENKIFGGMWDYLLMGKDGKPTTVLEMKTTKRVEDWADDVPEYYALQAALYAHLLGVEQVIMVCSFLEDKDYDKPEEFVPSVKNTLVKTFNLHERYPNFDKYIEKATQFWNENVKAGISPEWDEKKDADILKALRTNFVNPETNAADLIAEGEEIIAKIDELNSRIEHELSPLEKRLKTIKEQLKKMSIDMLGEDQTKVVMQGSVYDWKLDKQTSMKVNEDKMKEDGIYEKYAAPAVTYKFSTTKIKKEK